MKSATRAFLKHRQASQFLRKEIALLQLSVASSAARFGLRVTGRPSITGRRDKSVTLQIGNAAVCISPSEDGVTTTVTIGSNSFADTQTPGAAELLGALGALVGMRATVIRAMGEFRRTLVFANMLLNKLIPTAGFEANLSDVALGAVRARQSVIA